MKSIDHFSAPTKTVEIRNGQSMQVQLDHRVASGIHEVADLRFGASDEYDSYGRLLPGSHIRFVDLRSAEKNEAGASIYQGQLFDPSVALLAVDPAQVDWEKGTGYKGIRAGEAVVLGREAHTGRFPRMQDTTSRKHVTVWLDRQGQSLSFTDHSLNGTMITSGRIDALGAPQYNAESPHEDRPVQQERYVRTLDRQARILDAAYVAQKAAEWGNDRIQPNITREILATKGLDPIVGISLGGKEFMFSGLIATQDGRIHSLCYSDDGNGQVVPHMYYKSNSDGGWRMSPYLYEDGVYNKGDIPLQDRSGRRVEYGQYTQATKPDESIAALLEEMERMQIGADVTDDTRDTFRSLLRKSSYDRSGLDENYSSALSVECVAGYGLDAYVSGEGFKYEPAVARGMLESMRLPVGFTPDFGHKPQRSYQTEHTMLGNTIVEVYNVMYNSKELEWHVATDEGSGTVWLDRITVKGGGVTKYGTRRDLILAGALNAKPVDYRSQIPNMVEGEDYDMMAGRKYVSIKKTLDRMPWVRDYRRSRPMIMR